MAQFGGGKVRGATGLSAGKGKGKTPGRGILGAYKGKHAQAGAKKPASNQRGTKSRFANPFSPPEPIEIKLPGLGKRKYKARRVGSPGGEYELVPYRSSDPWFRSVQKPDLSQAPKVLAPDIEGSIYLSGDDAVGAITVIIAMNGLLDQMGYLPLVPQTVERGSWFTTFKSKARAGLESDEARVLAEQARLTAEAYAEKQKVENLDKMAQAASHLMGAVPEGDTASFDLPGLRIVAHEVNGKRHWVVQGETARTQAIRHVDEAKAISDQLFEEYYPQPKHVEPDKPAGEIEQ